MDQHQRELRRAAAQAFSESLEVLKKGLQPNENASAASTAPSSNNPNPNPSAPSNAPTPPPDLTVWEEAAADIEEFIKGRQNP